MVTNSKMSEIGVYAYATGKIKTTTNQWVANVTANGQRMVKKSVSYRPTYTKKI